MATAGFVFSIAGLLSHGQSLAQLLFVDGNLAVSLSGAAVLVGFEMALIAVIAALREPLRGMSAAMLVLAALFLLIPGTPGSGAVIGWQMQSHVLVSLAAYGLLAVGAIIAVFALVQDRRLGSGTVTPANQLFAPLQTTEALLFGITAAGFVGLVLSILSGVVFVEDLFGQHLVHKTGLSFLALILFGVLLVGRQYAGWRGHRAVYLYLWGFAVLCLAYFGSRYILEEVLGRSWS
ncbi:MAG: cytochrome c biogenesis protein CcsA [Pseudomonadota bacterium]